MQPITTWLWVQRSVKSGGSAPRRLLRRHSTLALTLGLAACTGGAPQAPDPASTPEGRLCGRAYGSTIDSMDELFTKAGKTMPEMPPKSEYITKCLSLGFTEAQLKCLDPKIAGADPKGCMETLKPVKEKQAELNEVLSAALKKAPAPAPEEPPAGEGGE